MALRTTSAILVLGALVAGTCSIAVAAQDRNQAIAGKVAAKHVATFDDLDFNVFSNQKWDELSKSHSQDVVVHWPDGHTTKGIERHIEDLKAMFTYAPDTKISAHPVKIAVGDWTAVIGVMEGSFTKPMVMGDKTIPPTGKHFSMQMTTLGHWTNAGVMDEEYLFWDNATYMKQLGVNQ
jgi:hypothetical protein